MPLRSDWSSAVCPIARGLDVLGDPWTLLVLRELMLGNRRYDGLRGILGSSDNVLSDRLSRLVDAGLVVREPYSDGVRPRYEYHLTESGAQTLPVLNALAKWGEANTESPTGNEMRVYCARCGTQSALADWCTHCEASLEVESTEWERPVAPGVLIELAR